MTLISMKRLLIGLALVMTVGASNAGLRRRAVTTPGEVKGITATLIAAPQVVVVNGVPNMAWEILVRNDRSQEINLDSVEVGTIASYAGDALRERILNVPLRHPASSTPRSLIRPGEVAVIYFLLATPDVPSVLSHVIRFGAESLRGPEAVVRTDPPVVLSAPLRGGSWASINGLHNDSPHRRAVYLLNGRFTIAQRYAIDWVQVDARGSSYTGDVRRNSSFYAYGEDLLASADGVVTATRDGIPDNIPGQVPVVPITLETITGNYVLLHLSGNHYALYAHLQPGSLRVRQGDRVTKGTVLGLVGNSGNSTEPHLHFHLCDANATLACEGLPYVYDHFSTAAGPKQFELPGDGVIVDFQN